MIIFLSIVFTILFIAGIVAYWYFSTPLQSLPTWNQLNEKKEEKSS
ncbi:MAG: hypothetical protein HRU09_00250 [Oligoflexales bacterium]|nr:hypothetical protein [Oligoflexales bacterium]